MSTLKTSEGSSRLAFSLIWKFTPSACFAVDGISCRRSAITWYCLVVPSSSSTFFSNLASSSRAASSRESFWDVRLWRMSCSLERCWAILCTSSLFIDWLDTTSSRSLFSSSTPLRSSSLPWSSSSLSLVFCSTASLCSLSFVMRDSNLLMSLSRSRLFCWRASSGVGLAVSPAMDPLRPSISCSWRSTSAMISLSFSWNVARSSSSSTKHSPSSPERKLL
mmetsp:Transcript_4951/g.14814  ORF Transcript_4951/g.14814 Transcript_4951/m.14814 type:complete len:221 (-) Transcript_4951:629-1291(-)